jgi:hypothetical protein
MAVVSGAADTEPQDEANFLSTSLYLVPSHVYSLLLFNALYNMEELPVAGNEAKFA